MIVYLQAPHCGRIRAESVIKLLPQPGRKARPELQLCGEVCSTPEKYFVQQQQ